MKLQDWMAEEGITIQQFALRIGRTAETVRRYVAGDRIPDKGTMPIIVEQTGGTVTPNDFFDIAPAAPQAVAA